MHACCIGSSFKTLSKNRSFWIFKAQRNFSVTVIECSPKKLYKGKSDSSTRWLRRQAKDPFVHQATRDGYRCRSAYKLLEIDNKFNFLRPGATVVDCGASPGSWTQVALQRTKCVKGVPSGVVVAVDLLDIQKIPGATILEQSDFTKQTVQDQIRKLLPQGQADVVISDMAPQATGNKRLDHSMIIDLNRSALEFTTSILKHGGCFLCKLWDGNETSEFMEEISEDFLFSKQIKPRACRTDSSELYIFTSDFKTQKQPKRKMVFHQE